MAPQSKPEYYVWVVKFRAERAGAGQHIAILVSKDLAMGGDLYHAAGWGQRIYSHVKDYNFANSERGEEQLRIASLNNSSYKDGVHSTIEANSKLTKEDNCKTFVLRVVSALNAKGMLYDGASKSVEEFLG